MNNEIMYSDHGCLNFIIILTDEAEEVCSKCGVVLNEKIPVTNSFTSNQQPSSSSSSNIPICDEKRNGSNDISPKGFTGDKNKMLNSTNIMILSAREKPLRLKFTNTCVGIGFKPNHIRLAMYYYDILHEIRSELKEKFLKFNMFSKFIINLQKSKTLTIQNLTELMINSRYWHDRNDAQNWIKKNTLEPSFEIATKPKKPKKLSTLNISFFSVYQVACEFDLLIDTELENKEYIQNAIIKHMHFKRKVKISSAITLCKTFLNLEKKLIIKTPTLNRDILLDVATLPNGKIERTMHTLSSLIETKKYSEKLTKALELIA